MFELPSTDGIMAVSFVVFCIIIGIGAAKGRFTFVFIYPERLLKSMNGYVVSVVLCEWQNL